VTEAVNLNALMPEGMNERALVTHARRETIASIRVHFRELEERLCEEIEIAEAVVGCAAWLTSAAVLRALSKKDAVSIIVQKEDFLRPDSGSGRDFKTWLRGMYQAIPSNFERNSITFARTSLCETGLGYDPKIDAIRCMGVSGRGDRTSPRMHHKFFVFLQRVPDTHPHDCYLPYAVWTGSFNPTKNATNSLENAIVITSKWDEVVAADAGGAATSFDWNLRDIPFAYFEEWAEIAGNSEPLDWYAEYVAPEWAEGT